MIECSVCHTPLNDGLGHYRKVTGYMKIRPRGANEIALREDLDQWICKECMNALKAGMTPNHPTLPL